MTRNPMVRKLRGVLVLAVLLATGYFVYRLGRGGQRAAVAAPVEAAQWVVDDGVKIRPEAAPATSAVWDGTTIHLAGMRNEVLAFQVVVRPAEAMIGATLTLDPLAADGGALISNNRFTAFREHLLEVTVESQIDAEKAAPERLGKGWYPCQLIPLQADETVDGEAGQATAVWIDLQLPKDAKPGVYHGQVKLADGGAVDLALPLELTVWDLTMPRETHFRNFFYYGPEQLGEYYQIEGAALHAMEEDFQRLAHDHRVSLATEPMLDNGNFNWGAWWARYGPYLDGSAFTSGPCQGVGANLWPIGISHESSEDDFKAAAEAVVRFFSSQKMLDRVFLGLWDEPGSAEDYAAIRKFGNWVDEAVGNKLKVMVTEQVTPEKSSWGTLLKAVDIFCSAGTTDQQMAELRGRGDQAWVYNAGLAGGPYLDTPALGVTAWGPAAWHWKLGGWYMWDSLYWRQKHYKVEEVTDLYHNPLTFDETLRKRSDGTPYPAKWAIRLNGDGVFFYPGEPAGHRGPVGGVRLKAFRRGAQDYEYLWLLKQAGHGAQADEIAARLTPARNQWDHDPSAWVNARREIAEALVGNK